MSVADVVVRELRNAFYDKHGYCGGDEDEYAFAYAAGERAGVAVAEEEYRRGYAAGHDDMAVSAKKSREAAVAAERANLLNTPEFANFRDGVVLEALHQRESWGSEHDVGKGPADWFWLIGYLAQKAMMAGIAGDMEKALNHCVSTAAALANWHAQLLGASDMRPGISAAAGLPSRQTGGDAARRLE